MGNVVQSTKYWDEIPRDQVILKQKDRRIKIAPDQCGLFPFNLIGWIESKQKFPNPNQALPNAKATGFLISNSLVLTVSHNFLTRDLKNGIVRQYQPISFTLFQPDKKGGKGVFQKTSKIKSIKLNLRYLGILNQIVGLMNMFEKEQSQEIQKKYNDQILALEAESTQYDFALLKLQKTFERPKYFQLFPNVQDKNKLTVTGYVNYYSNEFILFTHSNVLDSISKGHIYYDIDTVGGQSGSPVYLQEDNNKLVGLHKAYWPKNHLNFAVMITDSIISVLNVWIEQMKTSSEDIIEKQEKYQKQAPKGKDSLMKKFSKKSQNYQDQQTIEMAGKLCIKGDIFKDQQKYKLALQQYTKALNIHEKLQVQVKSNQCAKIYNNIGWVYCHLNRLQQSLQFYTKALKIYKENDPQSIQHAVTLGNTGEVYNNQNQINSALLYLNRACSIYEILKIQSVDYANFLYNIGLIYNKQEKVSQSLTSYAKALSIHQKKGKESLGWANTLHSIGMLYYNHEDLKLSFQFYRRAIRIYERIGMNSIDFSDALYNIACVYQKYDEPKKANQLFTKSRAIKESLTRP